MKKFIALTLFITLFSGAAFSAETQDELPLQP